MLHNESSISARRIGDNYAELVLRDLEIERSHLVGARFTGSDLCRARLTDVLIENSDLSGADLDQAALTRVEIRDCKLSGLVLTRCLLRDVLVTDCRLDGANFRMTTAHRVAFEHADLHAADFSAANLTETRFFDCDLAEAQFSRATARGTRFHGSVLTDKGRGIPDRGHHRVDAGSPARTSRLGAMGVQVEDERHPAETKQEGSRRRSGLIAR